MRIVCALTIALSLYSSAGLFADESNEVDEALLEDLGADLLDPVEAGQPTVLDQQLLDQFGEDLAESSDAKEDWLSRVIKHMQTAEVLLEQPEAANSASDAQAEALTGLDAMIAKLTERKSQCQGGECKKPGEPKPNQKNKPNDKAGKNPAQDAPTSTNADANLSTDLAATSALVKDLWGKLPERQRQQILQPLSEQFLPKYASEIEAYFRALARPKDQPAEPQ